MRHGIAHPSGRKRSKRRTTWILLAAILLIVVGGYLAYARAPLITLYHAPETFSRRSGHFMAHITGTLMPVVGKGYYRINGSAWQPIRHFAPRVPKPDFVIEMSSEELRAGRNELHLRAEALARPAEEHLIVFSYDPSPIRAPFTVDWSSPDLNVDDGFWERFQRNGEWRVRPKLGFEGFDRILIAAGAFRGGRRIETDIVFQGRRETWRRWMGWELPFGFGVLGLWGGRPDDPNVRPSRGWHYAMTWYYSFYNGVGMQMSNHYGPKPDRWLRTYRSYPVRIGVRYNVVLEFTREVFGEAKEPRFVQRSKWWAEDEPEPVEWLQIRDIAGLLPDQEYGIALMAYNSSVDFGPIHVRPLAAPEPTSPDGAFVIHHTTR